MPFVRYRSCMHLFTHAIGASCVIFQMLYQGDGFCHKAKASQTRAVGSEASRHTTHATASRKRKAPAGVQAAPARNPTTTAAMSSNSSNPQSSISTGLAQKDKQPGYLKPLAKRQKEPSKAFQTHSLQDMSAPEANRDKVAAAQMSANDPATSAGARLLPLSDVSHAYTVGGVLHTHHVQQTMHQLSSALMSSRIPLTVVAPVVIGGLPSGGASQGSVVTDDCPSSSTAGIARPSHHAVQPQHTWHSMLQQQPHVDAALSHPQHQSDIQDAGAVPCITPQSRQTFPQSPALPERVSQPELKPRQGMALQQASDQADVVPSGGPSAKPKPEEHVVMQQAAEAVEASHENPSAKTEALSQLIARARKLKGQLDALASRNVARSSNRSLMIPTAIFQCFALDTSITHFLCSNCSGKSVDDWTVVGSGRNFELAY